MKRPAAGTTLPYEDIPVQQNAVPANAPAQRDDDDALGRHIQARYGEASGVIPVGPATLLQRRITRLTVDHLPLWHLLQRRWRTEADRSAGAAIELYYLHGQGRNQQRVGFDEAGSLPDPPAKAAITALAARPPLVAQAPAGVAATVARQSLPKPAAMAADHPRPAADSPKPADNGPKPAIMAVNRPKLAVVADDGSKPAVMANDSPKSAIMADDAPTAAPASRVDWGTGILRRHLAGAAAPITETAPVASPTGQLPRRLVARALVADEGSAGRRHTFVARSAALTTPLPLETGHHIGPIAAHGPPVAEAVAHSDQPHANQPPVTEAAAHSDQPQADQTMQARLAISQGASTATDQQGIGPLEQAAALPLAQMKPANALSGIVLPGSNLPPATADLRSADTAAQQRISAAPAPPSNAPAPPSNAPAPPMAQEGGRGQIRRTISSAGTTASSLPPSAAVEQGSQPAVARSEAADVGSTTLLPALSSAPSAPLAGYRASAMGMPIVQRRRGANAQNQPGATAQAKAIMQTAITQSGEQHTSRLSHHPASVTSERVPLVETVSAQRTVNTAPDLAKLDLVKQPADKAATMASDELRRSAEAPPEPVRAKVVPTIAPLRTVAAAPGNFVRRSTGQAACGDDALPSAAAGLSVVVTSQPAPVVATQVDLPLHAPGQAVNAARGERLSADVSRPVGAHLTTAVSPARGERLSADVPTPDRAVVQRHSTLHLSVTSAPSLMPAPAQAERTTQRAAFPIAQPAGAEPAQATATTPDTDSEAADPPVVASDKGSAPVRPTLDLAHGVRPAQRLPIGEQGAPTADMSSTPVATVSRQPGVTIESDTVGNLLRQRHLTDAGRPVTQAIQPARPAAGEPLPLLRSTTAQTLRHEPATALEPPTRILNPPPVGAEPTVMRQQLGDLVASESGSQPNIVPPTLPWAKRALLLQEQPSTRNSQASLQEQPFNQESQPVRAGQTGAAPPVLPPVTTSAPPLDAHAVTQRAGQALPPRPSEDAQRLPLPKLLQRTTQATAVAPVDGSLPLSRLGATLVQRYLAGAGASRLQSQAAAPTDAGHVDNQGAEPLIWQSPTVLLQRALATASDRTTEHDSAAASPQPVDEPMAPRYSLATTIARATDQPDASVAVPSSLPTMTTPIAPATSPPRSATAAVDVERLADRVYALIEQRLIMERESLGL